MRYLITMEYATATTPLAPPQNAQLLEQSVIPTLEACAKLAQQQQIVTGGVATNANRITLIVEAASNEALTQVVQGLPGWSAVQVSVTPLQDFSDRAQQERQALAQFTTAATRATRPINEHLGQLRDLAGK
jgi:hypothetical protein